MSCVVPRYQEDDPAGGWRAIAAGLRAVADLIEATQAVPAEAPPDPLLTVAEIAAQLRRSPAYARDLCRRGAIKAMKDGRGYRARQSAVRAYERKRTA